MVAPLLSSALLTACLSSSVSAGRWRPVREQRGAAAGDQAKAARSSVVRALLREVEDARRRVAAAPRRAPDWAACDDSRGAVSWNAMAGDGSLAGPSSGPVPWHPRRPWPWPPDALPAPSTMVRPLGRRGQVRRNASEGRAASTAALNMASSSSLGFIPVPLRRGVFPRTYDCNKASERTRSRFLLAGKVWGVVVTSAESEEQA